MVELVRSVESRRVKAQAGFVYISRRCTYC